MADNSPHAYEERQQRDFLRSFSTEQVKQALDLVNSYLGDEKTTVLVVSDEAANSGDGFSANIEKMADLFRQEYESRDYGDQDRDPKIWITREGEKVAITDLHDAHLTNCIKMLRQRVKDSYVDWSATNKGHPDPDAVCDSICAERFMNWPNLIAEAHRRRLDVVKISVAEESGIPWGLVPIGLAVAGLLGISKAAKKAQVQKEVKTEQIVAAKA